MSEYMLNIFTFNTVYYALIKHLQVPRKPALNCHNIGTVLPLKRKSGHDIMTMLNTVSRTATERTIGFNGAFFVCTGSRLHYQGTAFSLQEVLF